MKWSILDCVCTKCGGFATVEEVHLFWPVPISFSVSELSGKRKELFLLSPSPCSSILEAFLFRSRLQEWTGFPGSKSVCLWQARQFLLNCFACVLFETDPCCCKMLCREISLDVHSVNSYSTCIFIKTVMIMANVGFKFLKCSVSSVSSGNKSLPLDCRLGSQVTSICWLPISQVSTG